MGDPKRVLQYEVKLLNSTGVKFQKLASEYAGTMKSGKAAYKVPSSGDKTFDDLVRTMLRLFSEVHELTADAINNHGLKLQMAAQNYDEAEQTTVTSLLRLADSEEYVPPGTPPVH